MTTVNLQTEKGIITGTASFNHTGNEKNLIMVEFIYEGRSYKYPFSRKTGNLYACKLPFKINLIVNEVAPTHRVKYNGKEVEAINFGTL